MRIMKKTLCFSLFMWIFIAAYSQQNYSTSERFRRDYDYVSFYDQYTEKWGVWQEGTNTVVFNVNNNGDIKIYYASGKNEIFRKITGVEIGYTNDRNRYQAIGVLDYEGNQLILQLFDNGDMRLIYSNGIMVQFTNSNGL